jgi:hypothetical protein
MPRISQTIRGQPSRRIFSLCAIHQVRLTYASIAYQ